MQDWQEEYRRRLVTAEEAASVIKSGDYIAMCLAGEPPSICQALVNRRHELRNVTISIQGAMADWGWYEAGMEESFHMMADIFAGPVGRVGLDNRVSDYLPFPFSLKSKPRNDCRPDRRDIDVFMAIISPPDERGFCSFGSSMWDKKTFTRAAKIAMAEVNTNYIRTRGDNFIHVAEFDYLVENSPEPKPIAAREIEPHVRMIAEHVKPLIRDGDTLQVGTGTAVHYLGQLGVFDDRVDLGWHSEITTAGIVKLIRAGVINGKRKTLNTGLAIATTVGGDAEDLAWIRDNPLFEMRDVEYTNDIRVISAHDNMVAINNALSVDLTGQICAETIGTRVYNGSGGQPEFAMGALLSKGGRSITCLPSTTGGGSISRIQAYLDPGTVVTVPRNFADYVVTEWGIASLLGKSTRERAEALIAIAHPDHRSELHAAARQLFWP